MFGNRDIDIGPYPISTSSYHWVPSSSSGPLPDGLVSAGQMETGELAFIGRADMGDQMAAGFFLRETREIHIPYGCSEHLRQNFEMLVLEDQSGVHWKKCYNGQPPQSNCSSVPVHVGGPFEESLKVGRTCDPLTEGVTCHGYPLELSRHALAGPEICRAGKIHPSHGCLYIPYNGREYIFRTHEMLMLKASPGSLQKICRWVILMRLRESPTVKKAAHPRLMNAVKGLRIPSKMKDLILERSQANQ